MIARQTSPRIRFPEILGPRRRETQLTGRRVIPDGATRARFNEPSRVVETKSAGNGITSSSLGRF